MFRLCFITTVSVMCREDSLASQGPARDGLQATRCEKVGNATRTPVQEPGRHQQEYPSIARDFAASSQGFLLNGHGGPHSQPDGAAGPVRSPGGRHIGPMRDTDYAEHSAAHQHPDQYAARRASHNGTYQAQDVSRLSLGEPGLSRTYREPLGRSHPEAGPRAASGGNDSLLHIPSDMQTGSRAEGLASYPGHEASLPNGRGESKTGHLCLATSASPATCRRPLIDTLLCALSAFTW